MKFIKMHNICIIGSPEREDRVKVQNYKFKRIIFKNFLSLRRKSCNLSENLQDTL